MIFFLIPGVSAFSVAKQAVDPPGTLNPGDTVNISFTVYAASGAAFPSYDDLQFVTDLNNPVWSYSIIVNGVENVRPADDGRMLTIAGFELGYRNQDEVVVKASLRGGIPSSSALGATKTLVKIQELDARGYAIPQMIVTLDRLIGEPTPLPTPAFGSIAVTSTPPGANVYLDNAYRGFTPLTLDAIPNGNHAVILRFDGYDEYSRTVEVRGDLQPVSAALNTRATQIATAATTAGVTGTATVKPGQTVLVPGPQSGSLSVTTSPPGALVYVDGVMKGVSPATIPGLSAGVHSVTLILAGYSDLKTTITIDAGTTSEYITGLVPAQKAPGFELVPALIAMGGLMAIRKIRR
ncbi:MAG: PEGA domain-containing protein [Methanoregula sp.]|nr:PEGA domain-containing protein [Methanoregula sp.]